MRDELPFRRINETRRHHAASGNVYTITVGFSGAMFPREVWARREDREKSEMMDNLIAEWCIGTSKRLQLGECAREIAAGMLREEDGRPMTIFGEVADILADIEAEALRAA